MVVFISTKNMKQVEHQQVSGQTCSLLALCILGNEKEQLPKHPRIWMNIKNMMLIEKSLK
jgi:hypothetical protein